MSAIFQIKRGTGGDSLQVSEPYFNIDKQRVEVGKDGGGTIIITKMDEFNSGSLQVQNDIESATLTILNNASISGSLTVGNNIQTTTIGITGVATIEDLNVDGNSILSGSLGVNGLSTLDSLEVVNHSKLNTLRVDGLTSLDDTQVSGSVIVSGNSQLNTISASGLSNLSNTEISGYVKVQGDSEFTGSIGILGDTFLTGSISNSGSIDTLGMTVDVQTDTEFNVFSDQIEFDFDEFNFAGTFSVSGSSEFIGPVVIDGLGDMVTFSGSIASDFDTLYSDLNDLSGSVYTDFDTVYSELSTLSGSVSSSFSASNNEFTEFSASADQRIDTAWLFRETGSVWATTNDLELTGSLSILGDVEQTGSIRTHGINVDTQPDTSFTVSGSNFDFNFDTFDFGGIFIISGSSLFSGSVDIEGLGDMVAFSSSIDSYFDTVNNNITSLSGSVYTDFGNVNSNINNLSGSVYTDIQGLDNDITTLSGSVYIDIQGLDSDINSTSSSLNTHVNDSTIHFTQGSISITESQISDLDKYTQTEVNNLLSDKVDNSTFTSHTGDGTIHFTQGSISITESQISDLDKYTQTEVNNLLADKVNTSTYNSHVSTFTNVSSSYANHRSDAYIHLYWGYGSTPAHRSTPNLLRMEGLGVGMEPNGAQGRIDASGDINAFSTSDSRLKTDVESIKDSIVKIKQIRGVTFTWKPDKKDVHGYEGTDVGVIAEEIEAVLPQLVTTRDNGYKAVKYEKLVALLIESVKEQQTQIEMLWEENGKLKELINNISEE